MAESVQFPSNSTSTMDDDPEKRSITAPETDHEEDHQVSNDGGRTHGGQVTREKMLTTLIICFCNLINFMDRYSLPGMFIILLRLSNKGINLNCGFSISGILPMVIEDLKLSNFQGGLLQSAFVVSYVVVAPLVGYLGDRYSRRFVTPTIISICSIRHSVFSFIEPLWVAVY